ncbi:MAG TPA: hypothetical protein VLW44_02390 [Streptosporangiaceae bacterium]|nr:hypothetical protein [Streptosporangiaceae bacterium]
MGRAFTRLIPPLPRWDGRLRRTSPGGPAVDASYDAVVAKLLEKDRPPAS